MISFYWTKYIPLLLRCCPASSRSRGWCSSPLTGPDSLWSPRACCCTCRSAGRRNNVSFNSNSFTVTLKYPQTFCSILWVFFSCLLVSLPATVLAAALRSRPVKRNVGLPHGSYSLPHGLPHQSLWRGRSSKCESSLSPRVCFLKIWCFWPRWWKLWISTVYVKFIHLFYIKCYWERGLNL